MTAAPAQPRSTTPPSSPTFYITTAIPYVNGSPHLGYALELVQADVLARHRGARPTVRFLAGTDDYALKNVLAAGAAGSHVRRFVDIAPTASARLRRALPVSPSTTSSAPAATPAIGPASSALAALRRAGDLYRRAYTGRTASGCEQFYDRRARRRPLSGARRRAGAGGRGELVLPPLPLRATSSATRSTSGELRIDPPQRNEVLAFIDAGLAGLQRLPAAARAGGWGIPVPGDPTR